MSASYVLTIELDSADKRYRAGETASGRVVIKVRDDLSVSGLHVYHLWRTAGFGNEHVGNCTRRILYAGQWRKGDRYVYPFSLELPHWPASHEGDLVSTEHVIGAQVSFLRQDDDTQEQKIQVLPGPETSRHAKPFAPTHTGGTDRVAAGLCGSIFLFSVGVLLASFASQISSELALGIAACVGAAALTTAFFTTRNAVAEQQIGKVFVGLEPTVHAGRALACLVRFQPTALTVINSVKAELVGVEKASSGDGEVLETLSETIYRQLLVLSDSRTLRTGTVLEEEVAFEIPEDAAPSLNVYCNSVEWKLELRVDIDNWPDWVHSYPIQVIPPSAFNVLTNAKLRLNMRLQTGQICPYCRDDVGDDDPVALVTCAGCRTVFHKDCMREFGSCSTRGCKRGGLRA